jgi:bifunctional DNase/RNase
MEPSRSRDEEAAMVQVRVLGVALDTAGQHIVLLKPQHESPGEGRILPIWIGQQEATSILIALGGDRAPRPLTHDLMTTLLETVGSKVEQIEVTRIDEGTFYAELTLSTPAGPLVLDARPSDAVALAVRVDAPLLVADDVLENAGMPASLAEEHEEHEDDEARLEEFKRFLDDVSPEDFQG